jgi:hypothetical protein
MTWSDLGSANAAPAPAFDATKHIDVELIGLRVVAIAFVTKSVAAEIPGQRIPCNLGVSKDFSNL